MRLLIYSGNFYPEKTGIGKYTGEMASWFAKRGHEVEVITGFPYYPEWRLGAGYSRTRFSKERWEGVTIQRVPHYIPNDGRVTSFRRVLIDLTMFLSSGRNWLRLGFSKNDHPDVVIAICPPLFSGIWPFLFKAFLGIPWVYHVQDFQLDAALKLNMIRGRLLTGILASMESVFIRGASRVSSISQSMCAHLIRKGAQPINVLEVPNWSNLDLIHPIDCRTDFRAENGFDSTKFLVMYAGAMGKKQGLDLILDAAERLADDERFEFVMVGSGSHASDLQAQTATRGLHNITFLPLQPLQRLNEMLGSADVHLIVQKSDAADFVMPSKLTNILAAGRPCIVTAEEHTELGKVVTAAGAGLVIPPENLGALIEALGTLADQAALRERFGVKARRYAVDHLGQDAILGRFEKQLSMLCAPLSRCAGSET